MKTSTPDRSQQLAKKWFIVDAKGKVLGRVATMAAIVLRGKHKAQFAPHVDMGDHVIIINAADILVTGNKLGDKHYYSHSGYNSGLKSTPLRRLMERKPTEALKRAIAGMIPANKLKKPILMKLHMFKGAEHDHVAQKPEVLEV
jgi:large subunit ribosomal protein L13